MRSVSLTLDYLPIEQLIDLIDEPNRAICHTILRDNRAFLNDPGGHGTTTKHGTVDTSTTLLIV